MRKTVVGVLLALAQVTCAHAQDAALKPLAWLNGHWIGDGGRADRMGSGGFSFQPDLGATVLIRRSVSDYPAQAGHAAEKHQDLMVIYSENGALNATYWDEEGQVIRYTVAATAEVVTFTSVVGAGPRYRLTYKPTPPGLEGRFEIAPTNDPDHFRTYVDWTAHRVR